MMNNTQEKISALRALMKARRVDAYIVPKADEYQGEFVARYAERLQWLTGFTGSAGAAVILADKACVLTDGRYVLQVKEEVDTEIFETADSVKLGIHGWLEKNVDETAAIGFDPWLHTPAQINKITQTLPNSQLKPLDQNLIDTLWHDQPSKPRGKVQKFSENIAGQSFTEKKSRIVKAIKKAGATSLLITLPESIAWLLNIRGDDIACTPTILSYLIVHAHKDQPVQWIIDPPKLDNKRLNTSAMGVSVVTPESAETVIKALKGRVLLDHMRSPIWFKNTLEAHGADVINAQDPCIDLKAIKTPQEFEAIKSAHSVDGVAMVKFLRWLDEWPQGDHLTELDVAQKIHDIRAQHPAFQGQSFPTIAGFGSNGALVHYRATDKNNASIKAGNLLLIDSGAQYYDNKLAGTTDITRTVAIGQPSDDMRKHFTLVLKGHISLAAAKFPKGTTGAQLDTLARKPLWNAGLDFAHGTGHGVGCYLSVHEEAANISPLGKTALQPGMLISNEPGYYKEGHYGIRIENLVFVVDAGICADTQESIMKFETISLAPIDISLVDITALTEQEKSWLNDYHQSVYKSLSPLLDDEDQAWLKAKTDSL